jgi:hypothetical protein
VCVRVNLLIQRATRMRHIRTSVAPQAPPNFSTLFHKRSDFRGGGGGGGGKFLNVNFVFLFSVQIFLKHFPF